MKIAALLHDEVLIEEGHWSGYAGERGSSQLWYPNDTNGAPHWQSPKGRKKAQDGEFYFSIKPDGERPEIPARTLLRSPSTYSWEATFEPFKEELPKAYPWLVPFGGGLNENGKKLAGDLTKEDTQDPFLTHRIPASFVRSMVISSANTDLILGYGNNAAVSMDAFHTTLLQSRINRGFTKRVLGWSSLQILYPNVGHFSWEDMDAVRRLPGTAELRDSLTDIENAAHECYESTNSFEQLVREEFSKRIDDANERTKTTFSTALSFSLLGLVIGELLNIRESIPFFNGAIGTGIGLAADLVTSNKRKPKWIASDRLLRKRRPTSS